MGGDTSMIYARTRKSGLPLLLIHMNTGRLSSVEIDPRGTRKRYEL